jgi:hypothetical protein
MMDLKSLTDRELLEGVYLMLIQVYNKINNDNDQLAINLLADLVGSIMEEKKNG